jgi:hypothetical protein
MKKFFVFLLLGYFTSFVLQAQNLVCGNVLDPTGECPGYSGVNIVIKDANGNVICSGLQTGPNGSFCCEVDPSLYPITICADVNCTPPPSFPDGYLGTLDLTLIQSYILGMPGPGPNGEYPPFFEYYADINGDGYVNSVDLVYLRRFLVGELPLPDGFCRIINEDCLSQFGGSEWTWYICIGPGRNCTVVNSAFGAGDPINFYLFEVGDANQSSQDCIKPLKDEVITSSRTNQLELEYGFLDDELILGFLQGRELNMLLLSLSIGEITMEDIEILDDRLDYSLDNNGDLHISYFSDKPDHKILVKNLFRLKTKKSVSVEKFESGVLIDASGSLFDLSFSGKNGESNRDKIMESKELIEGQIMNIIRPDGSYIDVQNSLIFTSEIHTLQNKYNLTSGIYFLKIRNEKTGLSGNRKIVIFN